MTSATAGTGPSKGKARHSRSAGEVPARLDSAATGLSAAEAAKRPAVDGPNDSKEGQRIGSLEIFLGQSKSLILCILIAAGALSAVADEVVDAFAILALVVLKPSLPVTAKTWYSWQPLSRISAQRVLFDDGSGFFSRQLLP